MSSSAAAPQARVALARSPGRMLAPAVTIVLLGAATLGLGAVAVDGAPGIALLVLGAAAIAIGLWLAVRVVSLRLLVEPGCIHLRGLGTDRRYQLARGSLARVPTAGPRKVNLGVRLGSLGWTVGRASLPSGERVHVIRLGATPSVILVPTEEGRLALAVASEGPFVEALVAAARTRAERPPPAPAVVAAVPAPAVGPAVLGPAAAPAVSAPMVAAIVAPSPVEREAVRARPLTGIERMWLEDRLARERRAAQVGARDEQAAASFTASVAALTPAGARVAPSIPAPAPVVAPAVAPAAATTMAATAAAATAAAAAASAAVMPVASAAPAAAPALAPAAAPALATAATVVPRRIPRRRPLRPMARRITRPELTPALVLVSTPLVGALFAWVLAVILGHSPGAEGMDLLAAALLLCGPVAALAVFLAHSRWPRLAGLSSVAAMLALLLVTRFVIG